MRTGKFLFHILKLEPNNCTAPTILLHPSARGKLHKENKRVGNEPANNNITQSKEKYNMEKLFSVICIQQFYVK